MSRIDPIVDDRVKPLQDWWSYQDGKLEEGFDLTYKNVTKLVMIVGPLL